MFLCPKLRLFVPYFCINYFNAILKTCKIDEASSSISVMWMPLDLFLVQSVLFEVDVKCPCTISASQLSGGDRAITWGREEGCRLQEEWLMPQVPDPLDRLWTVGERVLLFHAYCKCES